MNQVLMIDDDVRLAHMVTQYLQGNGLACAHAVDGLTGLVALATSPRRS